MTLHACRAIWGAATLIESDPVTATIRDAVYMPVDPSIFLDQYPRWGLYHPGGHLVQEAAYYRLQDHHLIGQSLLLGDLPAAEPLPAGRYLYGGPVIMHYGHFVTTALARLWPIVRGGLAPDTKIIVHSHQQPLDWFTRDYVRTLFGALGLSPEDFLVFNAPVRIPRIIVPRPAIEEQNYVHRAFGDLCKVIGDRLVGPDVPHETKGPLYFSKTRHRFGTARLLNEAVLQDALAARGVEIAYPETLPFVEQIRALSDATCVMGTIGSGLHTSLFCPAPRRIVALAYESKINANFILIDRLVGNRSTYVYADGITETTAEDSTFAYHAEDPAGIGNALYEMIAESAP